MTDAEIRALARSGLDETQLADFIWKADEDEQCDLITALNAECKRLREIDIRTNLKILELIPENAALAEENARLRKALGVFADPTNWDRWKKGNFEWEGEEADPIDFARRELEGPR